MVGVPIEYSSPLVNNYLNNFPKAADLFAHDPNHLSSFNDRHEIVMRDYRTDRQELVRILTEYNEGLHCGEKTRANLEKLKDNDTAAIITGQQAGILTGPLYTIYKTITVIQLAEQVSRQTGLSTVPVFWVAAEDHDFAEIDHLDFLNKDQIPEHLKLDYSPGGKYSVGSIPVDEAVFALLDRLEAETSPSEWKHELIDKVKQLAVEHSNLADWFAAVMAWLFSNFGLIVVNPLHKDLRKLLAAAFESFIGNVDEVNERLQSASAKVRLLGARPQVDMPKNSANLFIYLDGQRLPLVKDGDVFQVRDGVDRWTTAELVDLARNSPYLLSPNVVLRPVAQDVLLPILAYVAGPGEISYYALYREIYPIFDQRMPIIYPRVNITLIERGLAKNMEKYQVDFSAGVDGLKDKLHRYLAEQDRVGIDSLFASYTGEVKASFKNLVEEISAVSPELVQQSKETLSRILHQIEHLEGKTRQHHRKACDQAVKRFAGMEHQLFPRRNWQERVFNIFPYLFKYGPGLIDQLTAVPLLGDFNHKLIYLGE